MKKIRLSISFIFGVYFSILSLTTNAKTYILPPESIPDMETMNAAKFRLRWPHGEIPDGYYPIENGYYITYQHENLTYFFGPYENKESTKEDQNRWKQMRDQLIVNDSKFESSKTGVLYIDLTGMKSEDKPSPPPAKPPAKLDGELVYKPENKTRPQTPPTETPQQEMPEQETSETNEKTTSKGSKSGGLIYPTPEELEKVQWAYPPFLGKEMPETVDISWSCPRPGAQGEQNSCVGWATAYGMKSYQESVEMKWKLTRFFGMSNPLHVFSPAFVYNQINQGKNQGSRLIDALKLVKKSGAATWKEMPYNEHDYTRKPSTTIQSNALPYRIEFFHRLLPLQTEELKAQLAAGYPILIGAEIDFAFENLRGREIWKKSGRGPSQGHAMLVVGYNNKKKAFKILNSWGTDWGAGGYGWMDYTSFGESIREAYVLKDRDNKAKGSTPLLSDFNVGIKGHSKPEVDPSLGRGFAIWGEAQTPKNYVGNLKVVVEFTDRKGSIPEYTTVRGKLGAASRPVALSKTQTKWMVFVPFEEKFDGLKVVPVLYIDDFGLAKGPLYEL